MNQMPSVNVEVLPTDLVIAFAEIEKLYQPRFSKVVRCLTGDAQVSEMLVQEIFNRAYSALTQVPSTQIQNLKLEPWLCGIALNVTNSWLMLHT